MSSAEEKKLLERQAKLLERQKKLEEESKNADKPKKEKDKENDPERGKEKEKLMKKTSTSGVALG